MAAHAMTPELTMTEAQYLSADFESGPDFVDGRVEERNMGDIEHTNWQRALMRWFLADHGFAPLIACTEITVRVAAGRYRIADVAVFLQPPQGAIVAAPPLAVIEILSPSDTYRRLKGRMRDYHGMGVRNLFVVESRTEFTEFKDDRFLPVDGYRSPLEGSDGFIDWHAAAGLLWPNDGV